MRSETSQIKISVFSYPEAISRLESAISNLRNLINTIQSDYRIDISIDVNNGHQSHPNFSSFLMKFIDSSKESYGWIDIQWLSYLNWIINHPSKEIFSTIKSLAGSDYRYLEPFLIEAQTNAKDLRSAIGAQMILLKGLPLKPGQGPWGAAHDKYPLSVAIETTGYKESIFHEFFHQFGVSEGYDSEMKFTLKGCEKCWMQWEAIKGNGLCKRHQEELASFFHETRKNYK